MTATEVTRENEMTTGTGTYPYRPATDANPAPAGPMKDGRPERPAKTTITIPPRRVTQR